MAPSYEDSASSSEDDAPESVSLAQSKRNIKKSDDALQRAHAAEKVKRKLKNKEKDRRLKEQAETSKRRRKDEPNDGEVNLQTRMERAMQEAAEEMDEDDVSGEDAYDSDENEEKFTGKDLDSDEAPGQRTNKLDSDAEDNDEEMESGDQLNPKTSSNHLPDHLFISAFASTVTKTASKRKAKQDLPVRSNPRKRVRSGAPPKDILIGSHTIRTLTPGATAGASTLPLAKAKKFLNNSLGLKGPVSKKRGWERRPVNLGVMRRDGPATSFVRNR